MAIARNDTSVLGRWWWTIDRWTLLALIVLSVFGLILAASASPSVATRIGVDPMHFVRKQSILLVFSMLVMVGISMLPFRMIRRFSVLMLWGAIFLLVAVLFVGNEIKGAMRWISIFGFSMQPSEFVKPAFIVTAAWMLSAQRLGENLPGYGIALFLYALICALLLLQPDVGQTFIMTVAFATQFFLAGIPMILVGFIIFFSIFALTLIYFAFPHVQSRVDRHIGPGTGDSYQIERSLDAFANGGILGKGPGEGTVKNTIPDGHADFIFSVAGEEYGLIACSLIIALYAFIILRGFSHLVRENDLFVVIAVAGLLSQFGLQAMINMASTLDVIPTKGTTLPFISYGGSSLIALSVGMGMVLALTRKRLDF